MRELKEFYETICRDNKAQAISYQARQKTFETGYCLIDRNSVGENRTAAAESLLSTSHLYLL